MYCRQCGVEQKESAQYCTNCGHLLSKTVDETSILNEADEKAATVLSKRKWLIATAIAGVTVIAIIFVCLMASGTFDSSGKVIAALSNGEYEEALSYVEEMDEFDDALVEKLIQRLNTVRADYKAGNMQYEIAKKELDTIQKMRLKSDKVSAAFVEVENEIEALQTSHTEFASGNDHLEKGNYQKAIYHFQNVIEEDDNYQTALQKLEMAVTSYREEALEKAAKAVAEDDYQTALKTLQYALDVLDKDEEIIRQISIYYADYEKMVLDTAAEYIKKQEYGNAFSYLTNAKGLMEDDTAIDKTLNSYQLEYEKRTLSQANTLLAEKKFDEAEALLNDALDILSNNTALIEKRDSIADLRPVGLETLTVIDSSRYDFKDTIFTDSFGNSYENCFYFNYSSDSYDSYAIFNLNRQMETFTGSIVASPKTGSSVKMVIMIYVDDKLVYTSPQFGKTTEKIDFSVNVSGGSQLKIVKGVASSGYTGDSYCAIVNADLTKK